MRFRTFRFALVVSWALGGFGSKLFAATLSLSLEANRAAEAVIESAVDDASYRDPRSYTRHGAANRTFMRRLTLTNAGPVPLTGRLLVINGWDWSSAGTLPISFAAPAETRRLMPRLFAFWSDHITHADNDAPGAKEPLALLNFWGYALCGDTTAALTRLAATYGVPARKIPLNGHVAAEYFYDDAWHVFDSDQNVCYLKLDNRTPASAADLRADPFLARRTKVLGRYAPMDFAAAAFNTSLHEFLDPKEERPVKHKTPPAPVRADTLFPGEKMIIHYDQAPEQPVGRTDLRRWGTVREDALCVVEFVLDAKARQLGTASEAVFASGYPILRALNHTTGETFTRPPGQPTFEIRVKCRALDDRISVYCQRARASLPPLGKGRNTVVLATADARGAAELMAEWEPASGIIVPVATATLADSAPTFHVQAQPAADLLWWQVSTSRDFVFVPPNFDAVTSATERLSLDALSATFLDPAQPCFFRVKARHAGVWGEWSAPLDFQVEKPARPAPVQASASGNRLRFTWPDAGEGCDYLIFGSNRRDFLPEPFAPDEIVAMRDGVIEQSRPNKNLVAVVSQPEIDLDPVCRFYRIITRRAGALSVPGDLITTPPGLAAKLPPPLILQDRWRRVPDPNRTDAKIDEHVGTEMALPAR